MDASADLLTWEEVYIQPGDCLAIICHQQLALLLEVCIQGVDNFFRKNIGTSFIIYLNKYGCNLAWLLYGFSDVVGALEFVVHFQ